MQGRAHAATHVIACHLAGRLNHHKALDNVARKIWQALEVGTLSAWVTGQRKDQSPGTRMAVPAVQAGAYTRSLCSST